MTIDRGLVKGGTSKRNTTYCDPIYEGKKCLHMHICTSMSVNAQEGPEDIRN